MAVSLRRWFLSNGLWFGSSVGRDQTLAQIWFLGCLVAGPVLILIGARAAGLAVMGSVVSLFVSVWITPEFDSLPTTMVAGATTGTLVFGFSGLAWRPQASERRLHHVALVVGSMSVLVVAAIHIAAATRCYYPHDRLSDSCLPYWGGVTQTLIVANAAIVVLLVLVQAAQASALAAESDACARLP